MSQVNWKYSIWQPVRETERGEKTVIFSVLLICNTEAVWHSKWYDKGSLHQIYLKQNTVNKYKLNTDTVNGQYSPTFIISIWRHSHKKNGCTWKKILGIWKKKVQYGGYIATVHLNQLIQINCSGISFRFENFSWEQIDPVGELPYVKWEAVLFNNISQQAWMLKIIGWIWYT